MSDYSVIVELERRIANLEDLVRHIPIQVAKGGGGGGDSDPRWVRYEGE